MTGLRTNLSFDYSTVPTKDQVLVPETLLKKRKSQEKARAEKTALIERKKKVSQQHRAMLYIRRYVMHKIPLRLDQGQCCCKINHLSGLIDEDASNYDVMM